MIQDVTLTDAQRRMLERGIEYAYEREHIRTTGLEVLHVSDYGNREFRVWYVYENDKNREIKACGFFRFNLTGWNMDSVEFCYWPE